MGQCPLTIISSSNVDGSESATIVVTFIWVTSLGVDSTIGLDVPEGIIHNPSLAAIVSITLRAVNKILFTQRHKSPCFSEMLSLQGSCWTERPARSALTCIPVRRKRSLVKLLSKLYRDASIFSSSVFNIPILRRHERVICRASLFVYKTIKKNFYKP